MYELGKSAVQPFVSETSFAATSPRPPKRRRPSDAAIASQSAPAPLAAKRQRGDDGDGRPPAIDRTQLEMQTAGEPMSGVVMVERAREVIEHEFSQAILLKHQELRFINQELAKCQVALEQLRRCHLIPYPVNVPTPDQMLNITNGQGPAFQSKLNAQVPQWAPPFGVVDGPYARHYAKWLIPDPKFDGIQPGISAHADAVRFRHSVDGRSMRNNIAEIGSFQGKGRPSRGSAGQRLQSLSSGYPQPKDKAGPCVLKRADGKTVKLVCIKCHRENFSSTQGFINHCRIAHKLEFKSHEEAAVACGHPIEVNDIGSVVNEDKPAAVSTVVPASGPVHPFARENALTESEACFSVVARIQESLDMYRKGELPNIKSVPGMAGGHANFKTTVQPPSGFKPSKDSPNLSRLLQSRGVSMDLGELVRDAKTTVDLDDFLSPDEESEEGEALPTEGQTISGDQTLPRMRVPARTPMSPVIPTTLPLGSRPASSKSHTAPLPYVTSVTPTTRLPDHEMECSLDEDLEMDLSPNTAISNNAPSLVSDDGEYDDSMDGSSSESDVNDPLDTESVSDVAEINLDDDHVGPRSLRHHRGSSGAGPEAVRLRKEESKHVTFMSPVSDTAPHHQARSAATRKNRV
ncbi:hypothetical protein BX600DRAFT_509555 [Xylariales sp. PMI_506]|nr:hypothetical protein BX600DRAFT_509555 [Xylariales sp. PMI_506]